MGRQLRRQLPEERAEALSQAGQTLCQPGLRSRQLERSSRLKEALAGVVQLERSEAIGLVLEPEPLREAGRIGPSPPAGVLPARDADPSRHLQLLPRGAAGLAVGA